MNTGSCNTPWRKAFDTSSCLIVQTFDVAMSRTSRMVDVLTAGLNVSR